MRDGSLGNYLLRAAHVGDAGLRDRIGFWRGAAASDVPARALAKPDPRLSKEHQPGLELARYKNASATVLRRLRASLERPWICGFAQDCKAALPRPSAATVADSLIRFLVADRQN